MTKVKFFALLVGIVFALLLTEGLCAWEAALRALKKGAFIA